MFYLVEITKYNNGTPDAYGVYAYQTEDQAVAKFHTKMGAAMANPSYEAEVCTILNETGAMVRHENWQREE